MDAKITLSFDESVAKRAKEFAKENNISLSRLTELLLRRATEKTYKTLDEMPVSDWVSMVAQGPAEYRTKPRKRKDMKTEFFGSHKK